MDFTKMKEFMEFLTHWRIPGNSIAIYKNNEKVFEYQTGFADVENRVPMTNQYLFNVYSVSKVAAVTAALQLYERGLFLLDDPVYEYLPEYRTMFVEDADGKIHEAENPITIRQLFTMTAGLDYDKEKPAFAEAKRLTNGKMDTRTVIRCLASQPLSFEPGTRWQYSFCHDVLACMVEEIAGKRFSQYVQENIFDPVGMKDSCYHNEAVQNRMAEQYEYVSLAEQGKTDLVQKQAFGGAAAGHVRNVDKHVSLILGEEYDSGGSGITTSVEDYAKFASALANCGIAPNGEQIISAAAINLMRTNQLSEFLLRDFKWPQLRGYGYGLGVRTLMSKAASGSLGPVGEFGWGGAAGATILVDPENQLAMFYTHHMLNPQEDFYQPRLRNVLYACM